MSERFYALLLRLYPAELRHNFGAEMMEIFLEDIQQRGAARVWWLAIRESGRIAIPSQAAKREIAVPLIVYVFQAIYLGGIMLAKHGNPATMIPLALLFSLAPAFIALVALRVGDRSVPVPLNLSSK